MTVNEQLHQLLDQFDAASADEARAYLQSRQARYGLGERGTAADHAAATDAWEDEGGGQAGQAIDQPSSELGSERSGRRGGGAVDHLIDALDHESALEALAHLQSLRRPRVLSEAGSDDAAGTDDERAEAVEAWQLDRRHALDER